MAMRLSFLVAGFLALAAQAEAQAQICSHSSTTTLYVCFPLTASPAVPGEQGANRGAPAASGQFRSQPKQPGRQGPGEFVVPEPFRQRPSGN